MTFRKWGLINLNVLIVGGGAREHAICDAVYRSKNTNIYSVMNNLNPGIEFLSKEYLLEKETNINKIVDYAKKKEIDLALIGPEAPLEEGLSDELNRNGISVCSPSRKAARIETDKEWMRNLLRKYEIPGQIRFESFSDVKKAKRFIEEIDCEIVIKPIGLTGGKGVRVSGDHFKGIDEGLRYAEKVVDKKLHSS